MVSSVSGKKAIPQKSRQSSRHVGAVDAVVVNLPDLSSKVKLQNLLNYFLECLNRISLNNNDLTKKEEHLSACIKFIETEYNNYSNCFDNEISGILKEFLEEARQLTNLLKAFSNPESDPPVDILLTAKASHLQWLAVCLLEDIKIPLSVQ